MPSGTVARVAVRPGRLCGQHRFPSSKVRDPGYAPPAVRRLTATGGCQLEAVNPRFTSRGMHSVYRLLSSDLIDDEVRGQPGVPAHELIGKLGAHAWASESGDDGAVGASYRGTSSSRCANEPLRTVPCPARECPFSWGSRIAETYCDSSANGDRFPQC